MSVLSLPKASKATTPDHGQLASFITQSADLVYTSKSFWEYDEKRGIWEIVPDEIMTRKAEHVCRQAGAEVTANRISGVLKLATGQAFRAIQWDQSGNRDVCTSNGVLHYTGGGKWEVRPYQREDYRRVSLPIKYDPQAECPRFTQFVQEIFHGCDDAKLRIRALVEMIGLSLTASTEFEKGLILVGNGSNGKSVVLKLLASMLGKYASAVNPEAFGSDFMKAEIDGKLANIVTELKEGAVLPDDAIKTIITGEEPITVQHKHKDPFSMTSICKMWIGSNHMPTTRDFSDALFRRFTVLEFPNKFVDTEAELRPGAMLKDIELTAKLKAETSGILNFALLILGKAFDRGHLTSPPSSVAAIESWKRDCDQVLSFLEDAMVKEPGARLESADLFRIYRLWAQESGILKPVAKNALIRRIKAHKWGESGSDGKSRFLSGLRQKYAGDL